LRQSARLSPADPGFLDHGQQGFLGGPPWAPGRAGRSCPASASECAAAGHRAACRACGRGRRCVSSGARRCA
jgi:hypothetical protein